MRPNNQGKSRKGFVLLAMGASVVAMFGMMGLAIDLGRVYIAKNEAQTFTDFTAIAAARELDGTSDGVSRARNKVTTSPMRWNMNTSAFSGTVVEFSTDRATWDANPGSGTGIRFVRIIADVSNIDLYFLPVVTGQNRGRVRAASVAGQQPVVSFPPGGPGVLPFAPLVHNAGDPNFGFTPGDIITLRWPSSTEGNKHFCPADDAAQWIEQSEMGGGSERGYIQETSASAIRAAIEDDNVNYTVTLGQPVTMTGGTKASQASSLENRVAQDTNTSVGSYSQYLSNPGNGRRIGVVPMVDPNTGFTVVGFAAVFLFENYSQGGNRSLCAEYIGPYYLSGGSNNSGGSGVGSGLYQIRLLD